MSNEDPQNDAPEDLSGRVLGAEYRIERKLGMGGMSHVYLAHQISVDRPVVVKVMIPPSVDVERWKGRFMREARAASKIRHGGVVTIYSFGEEEGVGPFIAMEFVEGRTLREVIETEAPIEPYRAAALVAQACRALHAAHEYGVVHRDLKPDNLMIELEDGRERARVLDFGVAKAPDTLVQTLDGHVVGTPAYMAPEQARDQEVDGRTDLYSMGIILFELLTGRRPFAAPTAVALMLKHVQSRFPSDEVEAPAALIDAMERACAKAPDDRWKTAQEFAEALELITRPLETPGDLGAVDTDDIEVRPTTPMPSVALGDVAAAEPAPELDSERARTASAASLEPSQNSAKLALVVSLGALFLAVVAVGFLVTSMGDDDEPVSGNDDRESSIEVVEAGSDELIAPPRMQESFVVKRAKTAVFESRTVARGASEKPPKVPAKADETTSTESKPETTRSGGDKSDDDFQLLPAPDSKKTLVDPFEN